MLLLVCTSTSFGAIWRMRKRLRVWRQLSSAQCEVHIAYCYGRKSRNCEGQGPRRKQNPLKLKKDSKVNLPRPIDSSIDSSDLQSESKSPSPLRPAIFWRFSQTVENFKSIFARQLHVSIYARWQIFIQLSPTLTKLCHIKHDYLVHITCSKCPPSTETRQCADVCENRW